MVNLLNTENEEEIILPTRAMSPSPAFGRESEELLGDDLPEKKTKHKRMTFWGKKMFNNNSNEALVVPSRPSPSSSTSTANEAVAPDTAASSGFRGFLSRPSHENSRSSSNSKDTPPQHPVFGVPLDESVRVSRVSDTYQLPSIVFRCLEYLDAKKAILEEGLYRLSGSNIMMKSLKQKFDLGKHGRCNRDRGWADLFVFPL
jgi:RalA-binding protein 1